MCYACWSIYLGAILVLITRDRNTVLVVLARGLPYIRMHWILLAVQSGLSSDEQRNTNCQWQNFLSGYAAFLTSHFSATVTGKLSSFDTVFGCSLSVFSWCSSERHSKCTPTLNTFAFFSHWWDMLEVSLYFLSVLVFFQASSHMKLWRAETNTLMWMLSYVTLDVQKQ